MAHSNFKKISFIKLLEAVIKSDVKFVNKILEKAKSQIQKVKDADDDLVEKVLNSEFAKHKSKAFDQIGFFFGKGSGVSERQNAVHIVQGIGMNDGSIRMVYSQGLSDVFKKDFKYWKVFKDVVTEILSHEIVHIGQFDKIMKKYKDNPEGYIKTILKLGKRNTDATEHMAYLSLPLEMMAFARHAVQEFKSHGFANEDIIKYIKNFSKADIDDSKIFFAYVHFFKKNRKILKKFLQYVYGYVK